MVNGKKIVNSALIAVLVFAENNVVFGASDNKDIKCYGVAAAGQNDCATAVAACSGTIAVAHDPCAWRYLPPAECAKEKGALQPAANCGVPISNAG